MPACLNVCVSFYVNLTPYTQFRFYLIFPLLFFFGRCCKSKIYETPKNRCINVLLFRSSLVVYAKYFVCCIHLPSSLLHPISLSLANFSSVWIFSRVNIITTVILKNCRLHRIKTQTEKKMKPQKFYNKLLHRLDLTPRLVSVRFDNGMACLTSQQRHFAAQCKKICPIHFRKGSKA